MTGSARVVELFEDRGGRGTVRTRRLTAPGQPDLELLEAGAGRSSGPPLLFLHGAFAGAWCWSEDFLGYFAGRGRHAAAVSLRGHGGSRGGRRLRHAGLEDLVGDVIRAVEAMPSPPILVGHSLGGYIAQLIIGRCELKGLVLMGALPPDGMLLVAPQLILFETQIWAESVIAAALESKAAINLAHLQILFGEDVPREKVSGYADRMVPESPVALMETHALRPILPAAWTGLPTLVLSGGGDRLIWPATAMRTALYHGGAVTIVPQGGHFLMLDGCRRDVARTILDWASQPGLAPRA